ncbi:MAG: helix-turn-helix domain-containing protein [Nocardioidaceae bacterium]
MTQRAYGAGSRPLRADARRNYGQILAVARDLFVEQGSGASLEEIARRAGVGIGTLYRRFADRQTLMRAVVLDALTQTNETADKAGREEANAFDALARYMHAALDLRVSAVIPALLDQVDLDDAVLLPAREASARSVERLVDAAHAEGSLSGEVTFGDIGLMLVRLARPLPGPIPPELNDELAHRHLDLLVAGLRSSTGERPTLPGPALSHRDLEDLADG